MAPPVRKAGVPGTTIMVAACCAWVCLVHCKEQSGGFVQSREPVLPVVACARPEHHHEDQEAQAHGCRDREGLKLRLSHLHNPRHVFAREFFSLASRIASSAGVRALIAAPLRQVGLTDVCQGGPVQPRATALEQLCAFCFLNPLSQPSTFPQKGKIVHPRFFCHQARKNSYYFIRLVVFFTE